MVNMRKVIEALLEKVLRGKVRLLFEKHCQQINL